MKHADLIAKMTLQEKISICSGMDYWNTKTIPRLGIPAFTMSDGPHGLRKEKSGKNGLGLTVGEEATCFPPACLTACSFDRQMVYLLARALGREAGSKNVQMVLGPAINIKRSPLCGRNFEYFSEDPYLSGEMGRAWIEGMHSTGTGVCLKHFVCNNQEDYRMISDSIVDARALHELYLPAFRRVLDAQPEAVMCSYNMVNGEYMSGNRALVHGLLREQWGYGGLVMTDWGAMHNRIAAFRAGVDLEMPGSGGYFDRMVRRTVKKGLLRESEIDECADRVLEAAFTLGSREQAKTYDPMEHHLLAKQIAAASAVLLKNKGMLPLSRGARIAVVGQMAKHMRFQGAGSSHITAHRVSNLLDGLDALGIQYRYFEGYYLNNAASEELLEEAAQGCAGCDAVIVAAGLTDRFEAEGFDRHNMKMPDAQNRLIERVARVSPNVCVVLFGGAPIEIPWIKTVNGLLQMYLPGQAGGLAAADLLFGVQNPSGKLAESWPLRYEDTPAAAVYGRTGRQAQYRESVFVGYRYYGTLKKEVLFPFGFGLSYTAFAYENLRLSRTELRAGENLQCTVTVRNTGKVAGAEAVQVYVAKPSGGPEKELAGFEKVHLEPGEAKDVLIVLDAGAFLSYLRGAWVLAGGSYGILVGASSVDIRLQALVPAVDGAELLPQDELVPYICGEKTEIDFAALLGWPVPKPPRFKRGLYTPNNTLAEMKDAWVTHLIVWIARRVIRRSNRLHAEHPLFMMMMDVLVNMPVERFPMMTGSRFPRWAVGLLTNMANGRFWFAVQKQI